ncbi:hypothetical protein A7K94_0221475, partial [Modestobacter sp. VKM Ac-2676]
MPAGEDARFREATAGLSRDQARTADRASRRGSVPVDPRVREAAVRLLDGRRAATTAQRVVGALIFTLATGCAVLLALNGTAWWWLGRRRLRRDGGGLVPRAGPAAAPAGAAHRATRWPPDRRVR